MKNKVLVLLNLLVVFTHLDVFASGNVDLVKALSVCAKISNDKSRLGCFDQLAKNDVMPSATEKAKTVSISKNEPVQLKAAKEVNDFSKAHLKKTLEERGPESIDATISKVKQMIRGGWIVYLENGQKWEQKDTGKIKLKVGDKISLKKGSLGTVFLTKEGGRRNIRVKRLK